MLAYSTPLRLIWPLIALGHMLLVSNDLQGQETQQDGPETAGQTEAREAFLTRLRMSCFESHNLRGTVIVGIDLTKEPAALEGVVDQVEHQKLLEELAHKVRDTVPYWKQMLPKGISAREMRHVPIRSKYLPLLQEYFANARSGNTLKVNIAGVEKDVDFGDILRKTRLDEIYGDSYGKLIVEVSCVEPSPYAADRLENQKTLAKAIELEIARRLLIDYKIPEKDLPYQPDKMVILKQFSNPVVALQDLVSRSKKLDDVVFLDAFFDSDGSLELRGLFGSPEQQTHVSNLIEFYAKEKGSILIRETGQLHYPWKLQSMLKNPVIWNSRLLNNLQSQLVEHGDQGDMLFRQTRLDRAYFTHSVDSLLLNFEGVTCCESFNKTPEAERKRLEKYLNVEWRNIWRQLAPLIELPADANASGIKCVPQPQIPIQAMVASNLRLDGIRVDLDKEPNFDKEGKLILHGVWGGDKQAKLLEESIAGISKEMEYLIQRGTNWREMRLWDVEQDRNNLRVWAAQNLDETWIERLFFDEGGRLAVKGFTASEEARSKIEVKLRELMSNNPVLGGSSSLRGDLGDSQLADDEQQVRKPSSRLINVDIKKVNTPKIVQIRSRIAPGEHTSLPPDPTYDGIKIDRCYYDAHGTFVITGLLDQPIQERFLKAVIEELALTSEWQQHLPRDWRLDMESFKVMPLKPMLDRLRRIMPALELFDGIVVERAYHDAGDRLVLACSTVGNPDTIEASRLMEKLLNTHPEWKRRVSTGALIISTRSLPRDEAWAYQTVSRAISNISKFMLNAQKSESGTDQSGRSHSASCQNEAPRLGADLDATIALLDSAILHNPKDATAWFVRAMCHLAVNDEELAERDAFRVLAIERSIYYDQRSHLRRLERLQGNLRINTLRLLDKLRTESFAIDRLTSLYEAKN